MPPNNIRVPAEGKERPFFPGGSSGGRPDCVGTGHGTAVLKKKENGRALLNVCDMYRTLLLLCLCALRAWGQTDTTLVVKAIAGMQYDLPRIQVRPGTRVTLILENYDDMAHNLVVTKPGARLTVVQQALKVSSEKNYVPESPLVVAATKVVIPGASERITFRVEEGTYSYVCTYPGHGFVMYGPLYATSKPLPPLAKDVNLAPAVKEKIGAVREPAHAFTLEYPALYRTWVAGASPAALVVSFDGNSSYCWDAAQCRLRYAWTGGFVDNEEQWYSKGDKYSKIIGEIYWKEDSLNYPLRVGNPDRIPQVRFLGYQLKNRLPTFRYLVDGLDVQETLTALPGQIGLVRRFVIGKNPQKKKIYYQAAGKTGRYSSSDAPPSGPGLFEARSSTFSITIQP